MRGGSSHQAATEAAGGTSLLLLAVAVTTFERQALTPLFKPIATDFRVTIASVAWAATAYLVLYGLAQPITGLLSDSRGRIPVLQLALAGGAVASALSALAPGPVWLVAARAIAGAMNAAIYPTGLVYIAETTAFHLRQRQIAKLSAATSIATAVSVLAAGAIATWASWRYAFALPAVCFAILAWRMRGLPEPARRPARPPLEQLRSIIRRPWAVAVILLAFAEGATLFGFLNYFAPMLEVGGVNPALAGGTFAVYGVAVLAAIPLLRVFSARASAPVLILVGGTGTAASYALLIAHHGIFAVMLASLCAGFGFTMMHTTVQTWATEVAPEARGTAVALFACMLFLGGGAATAAVAFLASEGNFRLLFLVALVTTVPVVATLAAVRAFFRPAGAETGGGAYPVAGPGKIEPEAHS